MSSRRRPKGKRRRSPHQKGRPHRHLTPAQKRSAQASAKRHGRSQPGLWENVNASKGRGRKKKPTRKGRTRPGKRSRRKR